MTYLDTVNWMFSQLPMYQKLGKAAYKVDLSNSNLLAEYLGHPENTFKSIHVAGTNGKGSTSHMIASVLQAAGYKVGLYTSPHLKDYRERVKINGKLISKSFVINFLKRNKSFFVANKLSFFEMTVGLCFAYFAKQKVDIAIIEVGLGGRLDSTNIISPEVSVITNIGLDHTQFLGNTFKAIAKEKAGIIKCNTPVVIGETQIETKDVFKTIAAQNASEIVFADKQSHTKKYETDLKGEYQQKNLITATETIKILNKKGFIVSDNNIRKGLLNVVKHTCLYGRWQILNQSPKVICDTAHNTAGLKIVMQQLKNERYKHLHIVFGVVNDKELDPIFDLLPVEANYYLCKPNILRGLDVDILKVFFDSKKLLSTTYNSVSEAYKYALKNAKPEDVIYIGGSTFVVAEII